MAHTDARADGQKTLNLIGLLAHHQQNHLGDMSISGVGVRGLVANRCEWFGIPRKMVEDAF